MTLQVASPAPFMPVRIRPCPGGVYRLDGGPYVLMNGTQHCVTHLVNFDVAPATVAGCIAGLSRTLTIDAGEAYALGWDVAGTSWRALRMVEARIVGSEDIPPDAQIAPADADVSLLVEDLDGFTARIPLSAIAAYLVGQAPTLAGLQINPGWRGPK